MIPFFGGSSLTKADRLYKFIQEGVKDNKVNVEFVIWLEHQRKRINQLDILKTEWYKKDVKINVSKETLQRFHFTGLNNVYFPEMNEAMEEEIIEKA